MCLLRSKTGALEGLQAPKTVIGQLYSRQVCFRGAWDEKFGEVMLRWAC